MKSIKKIENKEDYNIVHLMLVFKKQKDMEDNMDKLKFLKNIFFKEKNAKNKK